MWKFLWSSRQSGLEYASDCQRIKTGFVIQRQEIPWCKMQSIMLLSCLATNTLLILYPLGFTKCPNWNQSTYAMPCDCLTRIYIIIYIYIHGIRSCGIRLLFWIVMSRFIKCIEESKIPSIICLYLVFFASDRFRTVRRSHSTWRRTTQRHHPWSHTAPCAMQRNGRTTPRQEIHGNNMEQDQDETINWGKLRARQMSSGETRWNMWNQII
jgi:hypothetical protein